MWYLRTSILACCLLALLSAPLAAESLSGQASVIDGDTIEIHGKRIRLHGVDAPESSQRCEDDSGTKWRCGQQAALALAERTDGAAISCWRTDTDHYGRMIGVCMRGNENLNRWLVQQGWAVAYRQYSADFVRQEKAAREAGRNIWSGKFVMPWEWRKGARLEESEEPETPTEGASRDGCRIKGNINRNGERIYHLPGGAFYSRTRIDALRVNAGSVQKGMQDRQGGGARSGRRGRADLG